MNKDTQNIYEAYITESPDQIAKIDKRIARLQNKKAQLQQSGDPTTSSSRSTTTTGTASSAPTTSSSTSTTTTGASKSEEPAAVRPDGSPVSQSEFDQYFNNPNIPDYDNNDLVPTLDPIEIQDTKTDTTNPSKSRGLPVATEPVDDDPYGLKAAGSPEDYQTPWDKEQQRVQNSGESEMPDNWRNASWAKRARTMGGRNPALVQKLAQKEWERKEAMRKERELATSELNPNRQTGMQYFGNQLKKVPGNVGAAVQGLGSAIFGKNKIPQTTAAGDAVYGSDGKLQWKDNSTGKPGLVQRAGGAVKKALTPSKPAAAPAAPVNSQPNKISGPVQKDRFGRPVVNRRKSRVLNQSTNAFDAVLQDKNVDHLID